MSQRMDERVGVLLCVCVGERAELELRVSEAFLLLQTPMWSTVGCIKGTKMNSFTHPHFFPNLFQNSFPSAAALKFSFTVHTFIFVYNMLHEDMRTTQKGRFSENNE